MLMDVFLIPVGQDRYELYCEPSTDSAGTESSLPAAGLVGRLRQRRDRVYAAGRGGAAEGGAAVRARVLANDVPPLGDPAVPPPIAALVMRALNVKLVRNLWTLKGQGAAIALLIAAGEVARRRLSAPLNRPSSFDRRVTSHATAPDERAASPG